MGDAIIGWMKFAAVDGIDPADALIPDS